MRIRYFEIQFFLEDDTIMIMEQLDPRAEMDTMEGVDQYAWESTRNYLILPQEFNVWLNLMWM